MDLGTLVERPQVYFGMGTGDTCGHTHAGVGPTSRVGWSGTPQLNMTRGVLEPNPHSIHPLDAATSRCCISGTGISESHPTPYISCISIFSCLS